MSGDPPAHRAEKEHGALQETLEPESPDAAWEKAPGPPHQKLREQRTGWCLRCETQRRLKGNLWDLWLVMPSSLSYIEFHQSPGGRGNLKERWRGWEPKPWLAAPKAPSPPGPTALLREQRHGPRRL